MYVEDFTDFAAAIDRRVRDRRRRRRRLDVRIHRADEAADPDVILSGLERRYTSREGRPLVPYAVVANPDEHPDDNDPAAPVIRRLHERTPGGWGRLRFPQYELIRSIIDGERQKNAARDRAFQRLYPNLAKAGGGVRSAGETLPWWASVARLLLIFFFGWAVRWWFGRRWRRRMKDWMTRLDIAAGTDVFAAAERLAESRRQVVLLCALLADLDAAFVPRVSPWRRRRRTGFVLLLGQPYAPLIDEALKACRARHVAIVIALDAPDADARTLAQAANAVRNGEPRVHVTTAGVPPDATAAVLTGAEEPPTRTGHNGFAVAETAGAICVAVAVLAVAGWYVIGAPTPDHTCIGHGAPGSSVALGSVPSPQDARNRYDTDKNAIAANNRKADAKERQGYTVKTIVYLGAGVAGEDLTEPQFNGVLPELSGVRLAQERINELADTEPRSDNNLNGNVYVRVDVREAGTNFANAPEIARQIARMPKSTVIGVIGLGASHWVTLEAQRILATGGLPMLGMGGTSEDLLGTPLYRQVTWDNQRQAVLAADFIRNANIIADDKSGTSCHSATRALVIGDPTDNYSLTLSRDFAHEFPQSGPIWDGAPGRPQGTVAKSLSALARTVCARLEDHRTAVFWAGRARRLRDFLREAKGVPFCPSTFTVVAGDDVTTTATRAEEFEQQLPGLTLFYAAHALSSAPPNNRAGIDFMNRYRLRYGTDAWYEDWQGPIAYDGLLTMAQAINETCQENQQAGCERSALQKDMADGVGGRDGVLGATGTILYVKDPFEPAAQVPFGKRFLMLRDRGTRRLIVMECGRRAVNDVRTRWGPGRRFRCPS